MLSAGLGTGKSEIRLPWHEEVDRNKLWAIVEPLLPPLPRPKSGRPFVDDRAARNRILFLLLRETLIDAAPGARLRLTTVQGRQGDYSLGFDAPA